MFRPAIIFLVCITLFVPCLGQTFFIQGKVTDIHGRPVAFVPVYIKGTSNGSIANQAGVYQLRVQSGVYTVAFRFIGYQQQTEKVVVADKNVTLDVVLEPENYTLEAYIPQDAELDSATLFMKEVIARRKAYRDQVREYSCKVYVKADQRLLDAPKTFLKADVAKVLKLDPNRKGIISLFESISDVNVRHPGKIKEFMLAANSAGGETPFGFTRGSDMQVNLYENLLSWGGLTDREFISPVADFALKFYHYRLLERFTDDDKTIDIIQVEPKRENEHVFHGIIYVVENDWRLYGADLYLYKRARIDFVDTLNIKEQYIPVRDSVWMPLSLNFSFTGKILGFKYLGYIMGVANNYNTEPNFKRRYFNGEVLNISHETTRRDTAYWNSNRAVPLLDDEKRYFHYLETPVAKSDNNLMDIIMGPNNGFRLIPYLFDGYKYENARHKYAVTIQEPLKMVFYNTVEGLSMDITPNIFKEFENRKTLSIDPAFRYGSANKQFTFNTAINYRYNPLKQAAVYGSFGSDFLDLNNSGTISLFLNSLSTLFTGNNYLKLYKSTFAMGGMQGEVCNGILLNGQMEYAYRETVGNSTLKTLSGKDSINLTLNDPFNNTTALFPNHKAFSIRGSATFTFNQKYTINPDGKFIEPTKYPRLRINYRKGMAYFGSSVDYDFASVDFFQDQVKMGIYGYASYFLSAGKFFNNKTVYYPDFKQFRGGQSFFFDSSLGSFHFLNFYTYSTDKEYVEAHFEHNFTGFFLNRLPFIRTLNIEEVIGGSFLTQKLLPGYKEYYFGLKRSVVRVDYGFAYGENLPVIQGFRITYNL